MAEESCEVKSAGPSSPRSPPNSSGVKISSPQSPKKPNRRVKLSELQLENLSKEDLLIKWREQEQYLDYLESQAVTHEGEITSLKESEGKYRQQFLEASHREKVLVRRLASKEQELQEYMNQISEMKAAQAPTAASLRSTLLDPAVNILIQKLRQELISTKAKLEDTQNELSAWKFTPDSNTGKRLMAKCRLLYQENEELGRMISSGRMAKLEGELALQKSFSEEVKKSQSELDEFLQDLDEDVEGMQSTIYFLQQELRKAHESVTLLQQENLTLKANAGENNLTNGLSPHTPPIIKKEENNETLTTSEISTEVKVKTEDSDRFKGARTPPLPLENSIQLESVDCNLSVEKVIENRTEIKQTEHNNDESSNDSTSDLMIKVENERIDEEEEINRNNKRTLRTKTNSNNKNNSGKTNGEEVLTRTTRGRDRSKREKSSVASSGDDEKIMQKKKRRETHVSSSTDRNEDVDNSIVTNGETLQSDAE